MEITLPTPVRYEAASSGSWPLLHRLSKKFSISCKLSSFAEKLRPTPVLGGLSFIHISGIFSASMASTGILESAPQFQLLPSLPRPL